MNIITLYYSFNEGVSLVYDAPSIFLHIITMYPQCHPYLRNWSRPK